MATSDSPAGASRREDGAAADPTRLVAGPDNDGMPGEALDRMRWAGDETTRTYADAGLGHEVGFGASPAVVVIDLQLGFTDPTFPVGGDFDTVVAATAQVMDAAHAAGIPVVLTRTGYDDPDEEIPVWVRKAPGLRCLQRQGRSWQLDPRLPVADDDIVLAKLHSSAFFGTELAKLLRARGVDTVIVCGVSTSGCVRASVVDAAQHELHVIVPVQAVGDRADGPHQANLYDMQAKWADLHDVAEVCERIRARGVAPAGPARTPGHPGDPSSTSKYTPQ